MAIARRVLTFGTALTVRYTLLALPGLRRLCMCILPWGKWMYLAASDVEILRHLSE